MKQVKESEVVINQHFTGQQESLLRITYNYCS